MRLRRDAGDPGNDSLKSCRPIDACSAARGTGHLGILIQSFGHVTLQYGTCTLRATVKK